MRWHALEPADASVFAPGPFVYSYPIRLEVTPARVWQSLASDESVAAWGLGVRSLVWTSPRPFGVGTTREVVLPLATMRLRERFFRWDDGAGYSFYVTESNRSWLRRFAEDYVLEPAGTGTLFTWTIALEPAARIRPVLRALGPINRRCFGALGFGARRYFARQR